jgi:hypothetical protein
VRNPSRAQKEQHAGGTPRGAEAGHEGLNDPAELLDGVILPDHAIVHAGFKLYGIRAAQRGIEFHSLDRTHGVPLLLFLVLLRVAAHVPYQRFLLVNVNIYTDVATRSMCIGLYGLYVGILIPCGEHELLDGPAELLNRSSRVSRSEFTNCSVNIGLAPEKTGAIVEQVEVVCVISLLLNDFEVNVLVIDSFLPWLW